MLEKPLVKTLEYWAIVVQKTICCASRSVRRFRSRIHSEAGTWQQLQSDDATLPHHHRRCCCMGERAIFPCFCYVLLESEDWNIYYPRMS